MSYLALARKWRPRNFAELAGQEHVMRALVNALRSGRVHHAFLFTGTRGVGKTTIARILAKSLNCETGVTPTPCGQCSACREIDEGRFVDLLEVDGASKTKVDDTRELLDNVQYSPARGRYKVYLIDEVHMLSTASFNALLKTLEEPPPHVKFLLATTDPQKLPVTVLSRCLQFNLKRFTPGMIFKRLTEIAAAEHIEAEAEALRLVARCANGSMRDALSLLDQVIAFGGERVSASDTRLMLGTLDRSEVFALLEALATRDAKLVLERIEQLDERAPDYREVLAELAAVLQKLALLQAVSDLQLDEAEDFDTYRRLAAAISAEDLQLFYQIAIIGRRDLELAPDARAGFEMVLLRMLAFGVASTEPAAVARPTKPTAAVPAPTPRAPTRVASAEPKAMAAATVNTQGANAPGANAPVANAPVANAPVANAPVANAPVASAEAAGVPKEWSQILTELNLQGPARQLAAHCVWVGKQAGKVQLRLDVQGEPFRRPGPEERLVQALSVYFGESIKLELQVGAALNDTPARQHQAAAEDRLQAARTAIDNDPNVNALRDMFGATVQPESIRPVS